MKTKLLRRMGVALVALGSGSAGCQTIATVGRSTGEAAGDIINDTAKSADDEIN